jgi:uncharacterized protein (TIGR03435 family)
MRATTLNNLSGNLFSLILGRVVQNESGVDGVFDVELSWRPDSVAVDSNDNRPSFFAAIEEQLGMKLAPQRRAVEVLVVESVSRPTPN